MNELTGPIESHLARLASASLRTDKKRDEKSGKQKNRDAVDGVLHGDADGLANDLRRGVFCRLHGRHVRRFERVHPIRELRLDVLRRHLVGVGLFDGRAERGVDTDQEQHADDGRA